MYIGLKNIQIADSKLNIEEFQHHFKTSKSFNTNDIVHFYRQLEPNLKKSTINWRVYNLTQIGVLNRIGRGTFVLGESVNFVPEISNKLKRTYSKLVKEFPFVKFCIWETSAINELMVHQPGKFYTLIEVDKDATNAVFFFLKELNYTVFVEPTLDILEKYVPVEKDVFIIKSLVTEAPVQLITNVPTVTIEKILVDIFCDDLIFSAHQGSEMKTIFKEAFTKYAINESKLLRYADRRGKKESFTAYLNSIPNLRQHNEPTANL